MRGFCRLVDTKEEKGREGNWKERKGGKGENESKERKVYGVGRGGNMQERWIRIMMTEAEEK